jgi:hypothetical protein
VQPRTNASGAETQRKRKNETARLMPRLFYLKLG